MKKLTFGLVFLVDFFSFVLNPLIYLSFLNTRGFLFCHLAVEARYFLKAADGTVIEVTNPGVRVAEPAVIERLAKGEEVDPSAYYFRTTPRFTVQAGAHDWLRRNAFVARGSRQPDRVLIDFYVVK